MNDIQGWILLYQKLKNKNNTFLKNAKTWKKKKNTEKNKKRWEKTVESRSWVEKDHSDSNDPPS